MGQNTDIVSLHDAANNVVKRPAVPTRTWSKEGRLVPIDRTDPERVAQALAAKAKANTGPVKDPEVALATLRGEVECIKLAGELASVEVERDSLQARLDETLRRHQAEVANLRAARDDWASRHDAMRAERDQLRLVLSKERGTSWLERLIGVDSMPSEVTGTK